MSPSLINQIFKKKSLYENTFKLYSLWRKVKVIYISKASKSSHTNPKVFIPISISPILLKTLEKLIEIPIRNNFTLKKWQFRNPRILKENLRNSTKLGGRRLKNWFD